MKLVAAEGNDPSPIAGYEPGVNHLKPQLIFGGDGWV